MTSNIVAFCISKVQNNIYNVRIDENVIDLIFVEYGFCQLTKVNNITKKVSFAIDHYKYTQLENIRSTIGNIPHCIWSERRC